MGQPLSVPPRGLPGLFGATLTPLRPHTVAWPGGAHPSGSGPVSGPQPHPLPWPLREERGSTVPAHCSEDQVARRAAPVPQLGHRAGGGKPAVLLSCRGLSLSAASPRWVLGHLPGEPGGLSVQGTCRGWPPSSAWWPHVGTDCRCAHARAHTSLPQASRSLHPVLPPRPSCQNPPPPPTCLLTYLGPEHLGGARQGLLGTTSVEKPT